MIEAEEFKVFIEFKNGDEIELDVTGVDVDAMFDKLWGRDTVPWINIWEDIVNLSEARYIRYYPVEKEDEENE